jgi:hypothetical protein
MVARFKYPRGMAFDSAAFQQLQADFLTLAEPGHLRGSWRYSVLANVFTMFLAPPPDTPQVLPVTRHCLGLLRSDVILLRGIGAAGLYLQLSWLVDHGRQNPGIVSEVHQVRSVLDQGMVLDCTVAAADEACAAVAHTCCCRGRLETGSGPL